MATSPSAARETCVSVWHKLTTPWWSLMPVLQKKTDKNQELTLRQTAGTSDVRFLLISHGRRRYARTSGEDTMTLDINAMQFRTLINAVAALAGIESLEFGNVENSFLHFATLPSIGQAREKAASSLSLKTTKQI